MPEHEAERRCDEPRCRRLPTESSAGSPRATRRACAGSRAFACAAGSRTPSCRRSGTCRRRAPTARARVRLVRNAAVELAERASLGFGGDENRVRRVRGAERARLIFRQRKVDPADASVRPEQLLRRRDVGHDRRFGCGRRRRSSARRRARARLASRPPMVSDSDRAAVGAELGGERLATAGRCWARRSSAQEFVAVHRARAVRQPRTRPWPNRIDAEQWHAQIGSARDADLALDDGRGRHRAVAQDEVAIDLLVEAAVERQEPMGDSRRALRSAATSNARAALSFARLTPT